MNVSQKRDLSTTFYAGKLKTLLLIITAIIGLQLMYDKHNNKQHFDDL